MIKSIKSKAQKDLSGQIIQGIVEYIEDQKIEIGSKLPSQSVISKMMGVSMVSLREAFAILQTRGILEQRHGIGTFLVKDPSSVEQTYDLSLSVSNMIKKTGKKVGLTEIQIKKEFLSKDIKAIYKSDDELLCLRRVRTADGVPFSYSIAYLFDDEIDLNRDNFKQYDYSLYKYLEDEKGIFIQNCEGFIQICEPEVEICRKLEIPKGSHILQLNQKHYSTTGELILVSIDLLTEKFYLSMNRSEIGHV